MTREKFIKLLDEMEYSYEIQGNKIVVTHDRNVWLEYLTSLPPGVEFRNRGDVWLKSLASLPPGVEFRNAGKVYLNSLTSLPPDVMFENVGNVFLGGITSLSSNLEFKNDGVVYLRSLMGGWFSEWNGNIKGIDSKGY